MHFGFVTFEAMPQLYEDEAPAVAELERRGHRVTPVVWTDPNPPQTDALVMRNPWDWFKRRDAFRAWLESLRGRRVINDVEVMLAFADKTYLPRLEAKGLRVVPSVQLTAAELPRVPGALAERRWSRAVLKPAFTANAWGAHRFEASEAAPVLARVAQDAAPGEVFLLQPFVPSVAAGEWSFVFFAGRYSHAVRKVPRSGEWRVQHEYGGVATKVEPSAAQVAEATALLEGAAHGTSYARVDCVEWEGRLHLMELELVEPELFFRSDAQAAVRFADAVEHQARRWR